MRTRDVANPGLFKVVSSPVVIGTSGLETEKVNACSKIHIISNVFWNHTW